MKFIKKFAMQSTAALALIKGANTGTSAPSHPDKLVPILSSMASLHRPMKRFWIVFDWKWLAWKHQIIFLVAGLIPFWCMCFWFWISQIFLVLPISALQHPKAKSSIADVVVLVYLHVYMFLQLSLFVSIRAQVRCVCVIDNLSVFVLSVHARTSLCV